MWIVLQMIKNKIAAEIILDRLSQEGILVRLKPVYKNVSDKENYFEILVLESEALEAREVLMEMGY